MIIFLLLLLLGGGLLALVLLRGNDVDIFPPGSPPRRLLLSIALGLLSGGVVAAVAVTQGLVFLPAALLFLLVACGVGYFLGRWVTIYLQKAEADDELLQQEIAEWRGDDIEGEDDGEK